MGFAPLANGPAFDRGPGYDLPNGAVFSPQGQSPLKGPPIGGDTEYDRLVRDHLEGAHRSRTETKHAFRDHHSYHSSWLGQLESSVREGFWGVFNVLQTGKCGSNVSC